MAKVYVPTYNTNNCVVIQTNRVVRVYERKPSANSSVNYIDYFVDTDYYSTNGVATFSTYSTIPYCQPDVTTEFYYRIDFDKIIVIFMCIVVLCYFMAYKPISRLFGRWLKL